jgi:hypothetical protein
MAAYRLRVFSTFIFMLVPVFAVAQLEVGVLSGLNFSDAKIEDNLGSNVEVTGQTAYGAGVLLQYQLSDHLSLATNVLYLGKAIAARNEAGLVFDVRAGYIEMPLYLKYSFGSRVRPFLFLGPTVGFLLDSEVEIDLAGLQFSGDFSTVLNDFDFGLIAGAGLEIPLWRGSLLIRGSYSYGFYDLLKGGTVELKAGQTLREQATIDKGDKLFTRGIQLLAGYTLPLSF